MPGRWFTLFLPPVILCIFGGLVFFHPVGQVQRMASTTASYAAKRVAEAGGVIKFQLVESTQGKEAKLSFERVLKLWQSDHTFVDFFSDVLSSVPYAAYFWESPPVSISSVTRDFEFIIKDSPRLAKARADYEPFSEHLKDGCATNGVKSVPNLGRDAMLVIPCMNGEPDGYAHLGRFIRTAPKEQIHNLWSAVGSSMEQRLVQMRGKPVWMSTSGLGVYWLHIRLDSVPKYYTYKPYAVRH